MVNDRASFDVTGGQANDAAEIVGFCSRVLSAEAAGAAQFLALQSLSELHFAPSLQESIDAIVANFRPRAERLPALHDMFQMLFVK